MGLWEPADCEQYLSSAPAQKEKVWMRSGSSPRLLMAHHSLAPWMFILVKGDGEIEEVAANTKVTVKWHLGGKTLLCPSSAKMELSECKCECCGSARPCTGQQKQPLFHLLIPTRNSVWNWLKDAFYVCFQFFEVQEVQHSKLQTSEQRLDKYLTKWSYLICSQAGLVLCQEKKHTKEPLSEVNWEPLTSHFWSSLFVAEFQSTECATKVSEQIWLPCLCVSVTFSWSQVLFEWRVWILLKAAGFQKPKLNTLRLY